MCLLLHPHSRGSYYLRTQNCPVRQNKENPILRKAGDLSGRHFCRKLLSWLHTMRHIRPIVKAFILICSLVIAVLLMFACILTDKTIEHLSFESARIEIEYGYNSTISTEKTSNVTMPGEIPLSEYECEMSSREKGIHFQRTDQDEQARRRALLDSVCAEEKVQSAKLERRHFLLDRRHRILYCWIHKVASTSWIAFMANLRGRRVRPKKVYREIRWLAAESVQEVESAAVDYRFRFIVVRHPFRRLISAYRDRIWAATKKYSAQAWTHAPRILRLTRPSLIHSSSVSILSNGNRTLIIVPTFKEFVQYLIIVANIHQSRGMPPEEHSEAAHEPLDTKPNISTFDAHWVPYYHHCGVCSIPYNMIIKLETIEEDKRYFMEVLNAASKRGNDTLGQANLTNALINKTEEKNITETKLKKAFNFNKGREKTDRHSSIDGEEENKTDNPTQCFDDKDKECLQVKEDSMKSYFNLHHLQVSNVGPSCPCYYFSQLSKDQIDSLKKIYKIDLKMFGYDTEEYENCVKKDK